MLGDAVPAHSNNKPCPCLPASSSHIRLLITALNFLLLTRSHPCPPQTNNLGGRILIIIASEKSDCLLLKLPNGHAGSSPALTLCLRFMIQTKPWRKQFYQRTRSGRSMRESPMLLEVGTHVRLKHARIHTQMTAKQGLGV